MEGKCIEGETTFISNIELLNPSQRIPRIGMDLPKILWESILVYRIICCSCLPLIQSTLTGQVTIFDWWTEISKRQYCPYFNSKCGVSDPYNQNNLRFLISKVRVTSSELSPQSSAKVNLYTLYRWTPYLRGRRWQYVYSFSIGFPAIQKQCSYKTFRKLKWREAKKQLPLIYMENFLEHSQT